MFGAVDCIRERKLSLIHIVPLRRLNSVELEVAILAEVKTGAQGCLLSTHVDHVHSPSRLQCVCEECDFKMVD